MAKKKTTSRRESRDESPAEAPESPATPPAPVEAPEPAKAKEPATPDVLARRNGLVRTVKLMNGQRVSSFKPEHLAAEALHGWKDHAHHANAPIVLSDEDYLEAVKAAGMPVQCTDGKFHYVPHKPALSKFHELRGTKLPVAGEPKKDEKE